METNIGELNRRVAIQTQSTTQDVYGQQLSVWTTAYQCWAGIDIQNSQLMYSTAEFIEKVTYRIAVRYTKGFIFQPNQRIVYTDPSNQQVHTYQIQAILNTKQANNMVVLLAYELEGTA